MVGASSSKKAKRGNRVIATSRHKLGSAALAALLLAATALATSAASAAEKLDKAKLVGTWMLVSMTNTTPDGKTTQTYGPNDGTLVFDRNGTFVQVLARFDMPKFASNDRSTGTADENKAVVQGSLAIFGEYTVSTKKGTISLHIDRSSYPNWTGSEQLRVVKSLTGYQLKWEVPAPSIGGSSTAVWKRKSGKTHVAQQNGTAPAG
jgi:lipocalin-like protein